AVLLQAAADGRLEADHSPADGGQRGEHRGSDRAVLLVPALFRPRHRIDRYQGIGGHLTMAFTRRRFLVMGAALVGPVLAACGGAAAPPAAPAKPTEAPKPSGPPAAPPAVPTNTTAPAPAAAVATTAPAAASSGPPSAPAKAAEPTKPAGS